MINIYSIKEVIEASNNILNRTKKKSKVKLNLPIKPSNIKLQNLNTLILTNEVIDEKEINKNQSKSELSENLNKRKSIKFNKKDKTIDELYLRFNKKITKNTLKLMFELQKEVSYLKKTKELLQLSNKQSKKHISKLNTELKTINNTNKNLKEVKISLDEEITKMRNTINSCENDIQILEKNKLQLENDLKDKVLLEEKITKLTQELLSSKDKIETLSKSKSELEKELSDLKTKHEISQKQIYDISDVENKNKFYQDENLRIGSELLEVKKKYDILKNEIQKYENQKSNLISKINSVNEALSDSNLLTNVFENKVEKKVEVIDHNKIEINKKNFDIEKKIKEIFENK